MGITLEFSTKAREIAAKAPEVQFNMKWVIRHGNDALRAVEQCSALDTAHSFWEMGMELCALDETLREQTAREKMTKGEARTIRDEAFDIGEKVRDEIVEGLERCFKRA